MTITTTFGAEPAMITERELFQAFLKATMKPDTADERPCTPLDLLLDPGQYGEIDDATTMLLDYIIDDEETEHAIEVIRDDLANYLEGLSTVLSGFKTFKAIHSAEHDLGDQPKDDTSEAY